MISAAIVGASGYVGKKLIQLCSSHPFITELSLYANSSSGKKLYELFPDLQGAVDDLEILAAEDISLGHDVYFLALPHMESMKTVPSLVEKNKIVIDLSADYRLDSSENYSLWYRNNHSSPELLDQKIYGLADYPGLDYCSADLIANPGCYPTATLLSLLPIVENFGDQITSMSTVAYSGTSGAGKSAKLELSLTEMNGNVRAYNVHQHRHEVEILQSLQKNGLHAPFSFVTHLLPVAVGIYATSCVHLKEPVETRCVQDAFEKVYSDSAFVRLRDCPPDLNWVVGTNFCDIFVSVRDCSIIVTTAIDNLIKGAAGQAVQNLNRKFGWDETTGILREAHVSIY